MLSKKDALHFIANLMSEEEAVGEVTSLATSRLSKRTKESKSKVAKKRKATKEQEGMEDTSEVVKAE